MDQDGSRARNPQRTRPLAVNHSALNNFRTFVNISTFLKSFHANRLRAWIGPTLAPVSESFVDKTRNEFEINTL